MTRRHLRRGGPGLPVTWRWTITRCGAVRTGSRRGPLSDPLLTQRVRGQMHQHHGRGLGVHAGEEVRDARVRVPLRGRSGVKEGV